MTILLQSYGMQGSHADVTLTCPAHLNITDQGQQSPSIKDRFIHHDSVWTHVQAGPASIRRFKPFWPGNHQSIKTARIPGGQPQQSTGSHGALLLGCFAR